MPEWIGSKWIISSYTQNQSEDEEASVSITVEHIVL